MDLVNEKENITFHDRICELYEHARDKNYKIGRKMFAEMCGITKGQLNGYLAGTADPSTEVLKIIAANQNVCVSWLVGETGVRHLHTSKVIEDMPPEVLNELKFLLAFLQFKHSNKLSPFD